jgi:hypothetical protein
MRMAQAVADTMMRRRAALAEHPFGTLKCRAGYRHLLLRGFHRVRGEWSLMALCYNFARVLSILGLDRFLAYLAKNHSNRSRLLPKALTDIVLRLRTDMPRLWSGIGRPITAIRPALGHAA